MSEAPSGRLSIAIMLETVGLGGAEKVILQLAEELRARGHTVHPIVPAGREGWLLDGFREIGMQWHAYDQRGAIDPGFPKRLGAQLQSLGVDVIHSHEFTMAVYGAAAARRIGRPHVVTMHGNQTMTRRLRRRLALKWALRNSQATVGVSRDTCRHLEAELKLRPGEIRIVPNGIPYQPGDAGRVRRELALADDEVLVLAVGSLTQRKGHAVMIDALHRLRELPVRWRAAIAGKGPERDALEALLVERQLADRIHLLGPRNDVPDLQAAADVFVMPSLWEGLPLAVLEAMFARSAIVASETSGIPEAIDHDVEGLLTPPGDVDALAAALERVLLDSALRERLGEAAFRRAQTHHTIAAMTDAYEQLYRSTPAAGGAR